MSKYNWTVAPGQLEDAIASGRMSGELSAAFAGMNNWSASARRDIALAELLASVYGGDVLFNVALGFHALWVNGSGYNNTALGYQTLAVNVDGFNNVAVGYQALVANTSGNGNTAVGVTAQVRNITGNNNTALGIDALYTNTNGSNNTAVGSNALGFGSGGGSNVAVGWQALFSGGGASINTAVGLQAMGLGTVTGTNNVAVGSAALGNVTSGSTNTAVGLFALLNNLTGAGNVALGALAGAYELGSNAFYVNNVDRVNTAGDKSLSLIYGVFAATAAAQSLTVNATFTVKGQQAIIFGAKAGSYQQASFSTEDAANPIQLTINNSTNLIMQLQSVEQGIGYRAIQLNVNGGAVMVGVDPGGANLLRVGGALTVNSATMIATKTAFTNGAAAAVGTLTNAPAAGNPTKWVPVDDNGTTRYIPAW